MNVASGHRSGRLPRVVGCGLLCLIGGLFTVVEVVHVTYMSSTVGVVVQALVPLLLGLMLFAAGVLLWWSDLDGAEILRIDAWVVVGMFALTAVFVWSVGHQVLRGEPFPHAEFVLVNNLAAGGTIGLVVGRYDVRSRRRRVALDAERDRVAEQRAKLAFLNNELRHHVLNGVGVILTRTERLESHVDPAGREHLGALSDRANHLAGVIDRVRTVARAFTGEHDAEPRAVDLSAVIDAQLEHVSESYPGASFRAALPPDVAVRADDLLGVVFENLLSNAVEHNDAEAPSVVVTADVGRELVTVRVADNGPGFEERSTGAPSWEDWSAPDTRMGIGLAIVNALVDRYGGRLRFEDGEESAVVVELPRAESGSVDVTHRTTS